MVPLEVTDTNTNFQMINNIINRLSQDRDRDKPSVSYL